jgi:hypothetical protein
MQAVRLGAAVMVAVMLIAPAASAQPAEQDVAERWHRVVSDLEPAAYVAIRMKNGRKVKGTVVAAGDRSFTFMPHTRIPVPAREVDYTEIATLERSRQGMSPGLKVLIGAGAGVGGFLLLMIAAFAAYGD